MVIKEIQKLAEAMNKAKPLACKDSYSIRYEIDAIELAENEDDRNEVLTKLRSLANSLTDANTTPFINYKSKDGSDIINKCGFVFLVKIPSEKYTEAEAIILGDVSKKIDSICTTYQMKVKNQKFNISSVAGKAVDNCEYEETDKK